MHHKGRPPLTKEFLRYLTIEKGLSENTVSNYGKDLALLTHYAYQLSTSIQALHARDVRNFICPTVTRRPRPGNSTPDRKRRPRLL